MNDDRTPDLHAQIMNIPARRLSFALYADSDLARECYMEGHRDARHAAAELAAAALSAAPAQEPVAWRGAMQQALNALEMAQAGLEWYRDAQPENVNGSDDEADEVIGDAMQSLRDALSASPLPQEPQEGKALTDERVYELAKEHFGGCGHDLIWQDDPRYATACDMPKDARWSTSTVRAEQTLAFARAIERELRGAQEGKAGEDARTRGMAIYRRAKETAMERAALVAFNTYFFKCTPSCDVATWTAAWKKAIAWWTSPVATQQQDFGVGDDRG